MIDLLRDMIRDGLFKMLGVIIIFIIAFFTTLKAIDVYLFKQVPIKVMVDDKIVYEGPSAGATISSGGRTTQVKIYGGFLYSFPRKIYVSENVKVEGEK